MDKARFIICTLSILVIQLLNANYFDSPVLGISAFLAYLFYIGNYLGTVFFSDEPLNMLLGVFIALCWIIVGETSILLLQFLRMPWILLPFASLPLLLVFITTRMDETSRASTNQSLSWRDIRNLFGRFSDSKVLIFWTILIVSFLIVLKSRTGAMIFSVWEVIPPYFLIFLFSVILSYFFVQHKLKKRGDTPGFSLNLSFFVAFLVFGLFFLTCEVAWGVDQLARVGSVRVTYIQGFRGGHGADLLARALATNFHERGIEALVTSLVRLSSSEYNFLFTKNLMTLLVPLCASIYVPFFTYLFVKDIYRLKRVFYFTPLSFLLFPSFWLLGVTSGMNFADIFLMGTLYLNFKLLYRRSNNISFVFLSGLATFLIHPFTGVYTISSTLITHTILFVGEQKLILKFSPGSKKIEIKLRALVMPSLCILLSFSLPFELIIGQKNTFFKLPSLEGVGAFCIPRIWEFGEYTADFIVSEGYNWGRYLLFLAGFLLLFHSRSHLDKVRSSWIVSIIITFWLTWFLTVNCVEPLRYGTHRFARILDFSLLPLAGLVLHEVSNWGIKIFKFSSFLKRAIVSLGFVSLICLMTISPYIGFLSPSFPKWGITTPGRSGFRSVSTDEVKAINFIINSTEGDYMVITGDGFLAKIGRGMLGYHVYHTNNSQFRRFDHRQFSKTMMSPNVMAEISEGVNIPTFFLFFNDFNIERTQIPNEVLDRLKELSAESRIYGKTFRTYVYRFEFTSFTKHALRFDGEDDYIKIFPNREFNESFNALSIEAWIKVRARERERTGD